MSADPQVNTARIQIRFVSRSRNNFTSRAVVNEAEMMKELEQRYGDKADVSLLHFNGSLTSAMMAVQRADILIGMHGAGDLLCACLAHQY